METFDDDVVERKEKTVSALQDDYAYNFPEPVKLKKEDELRSKRINIVLPPESAVRLENLQRKLETSTQTEAISKSLHLMETLVAAHESGSKVYFANAAGEMVEFRMFAS